MFSDPWPISFTAGSVLSLQSSYTFYRHSNLNVHNIILAGCLVHRANYDPNLQKVKDVHTFLNWPQQNTVRILVAKCPFQCNKQTVLISIKTMEKEKRLICVACTSSKWLTRFFSLFFSRFFFLLLFSYFVFSY